jgi:predicted MFS family arabinose efflux permease
MPIIGIIQKNIYLLLTGRLISGLGSASQPVAQAAVADLCKREEKAFFLGSIALMMTLALILGPLAGGILSNSHIVSWFNSKTPFEFALALSVINLLLILFFFRETIQSNQKQILFSVREVVIGLPNVIKKFRVGLLILLFLCLELGWSQYYQSISLFLHLQTHFSTLKISIFSANMGIVMVIGLLIVYPLLLRLFSLKKIMQCSILAVLMGLSACALFHGALIQWIFSSIIALFTGITYVSLVALISNQVADDTQGLVMGYLSAILYFAWMMTSFLSGFLMSLHAALPLYVAASFLLVGFVAFLFQEK